MEIGSVMALLVSFVGFCWTMYRDKSSDTAELTNRLIKAETKLAIHDNDIERLEIGLDELRKSFQTLDKSLNELNVKIEKLITLIEKGA